MFIGVLGVSVVRCLRTGQNDDHGQLRGPWTAWEESRYKGYAETFQMTRSAGNTNATFILPLVRLAVQRRCEGPSAARPGWAISSSQPHCERFNQSSDCHDSAEATLHSIGMLGCVSAHHADS